MVIDSRTLDNPENLKQAFEVFNQLSQTLTYSYRALENQVARLSEELAAARSARLQTLMEKEKLANQLQQLLEALPGGVIVLGGSGRVIECNPAAIELLGEPLIGELWAEVASRNFVSGMENPHQRRLKNGKIVSLSARSLGDEPGQILLLADVSEMRKLQNLVDQHQRLSAMGEMVASMAHQVRTPLSAAILYASQLDNAQLDATRRRLFTARILERLHHLERQVNDMLVFAREGRFVTSQVSLEELIQQIKNVSQPLFTASNTVIEFNDPGQPITFQGNTEALVGVFLNLLTNAVQATAGQGHIEMRCRVADDSICISVVDNGPGMDEATKDRIFEPFFTTRPNGTGLGLAVVSSIVKAHGGFIQCESVPGQGTAFHVHLPLALEETPFAGSYCRETASRGEPEVMS
ncbi:MAG: hypothetical protein AXA67_06210 [Methylothermaceae bacteria B42]|nr:MAG: hypothetical protein AXA67_06210 [Methylothermaceae bacteria B42]HHJ39869.1 PAS domain-containing protein [Methylothermaceae bacterium]